MDTATVPQIEKRLYRNNTAGYLGVVKLDHKGEEYGDNVEPLGTVWLSDQEALLTARAPRRPEDNPFEEQVFIGLNSETSAREEYRMRPLTLESADSRYVPTNDRYVPTQDEPKGAPAVARASAQAPAPVAAPPSSGSSAVTEAPPPAPPVAAPAAAPVPRTQPVGAPPRAPVTSISGQRVEGDNAGPASGGDERESWIVPPEAPGRVLPGALGGSDEGADAVAAPEPTVAPAAAERYVPPVSQGAAPQQPGGEEYAEAVDPRIGEETGAATPPERPQPEGEYAAHEEVGTPTPPPDRHTE